MFGFPRSKNVRTNPIGSVRIHPTDKIRLNSGLCTEIRIPSVGIGWDPSVGIRRNLSVGFGRPLLLINSFNKLVPGANFRGRSQPRIDSVDFDTRILSDSNTRDRNVGPQPGFRQDLYEVSSDSNRIRLSD